MLARAIQASIGECRLSGIVKTTLDDFDQRDLVARTLADAFEARNAMFVMAKKADPDLANLPSLSAAVLDGQSVGLRQELQARGYPSSCTPPPSRPMTRLLLVSLRQPLKSLLGSRRVEAYEMKRRPRCARAER